MRDDTNALLARLNQEIENQSPTRDAANPTDYYAYKCGYLTTVLGMLIERVPGTKEYLETSLSATESFRQATAVAQLQFGAIKPQR